jgi:sRNA-binding protein
MGSLIWVSGGGDKGASKAARAQLEQAKAETERMRKQAEEEKRDLSAEAAARRMARARGGSRMLLSDSRLNPEEGVDETLGAM